MKHQGKCAFIWDMPAAGKVPEGLKYTIMSTAKKECFSLVAAAVMIHTAPYGNSPVTVMMPYQITPWDMCRMQFLAPSSLSPTSELAERVKILHTKGWWAE